MRLGEAERPMDDSENIKAFFFTRAETQIADLPFRSLVAVLSYPLSPRICNNLHTIQKEKSIYWEIII